MKIFVLGHFLFTILLGARHDDNGDVLLCGGRTGDGQVMSDCVAYTPRTKVF